MDSGLMMTFERWTLRRFEPDPYNIAEMWKRLQKHPTLFSDYTRQDIKNWISLVYDPSVVCHEVLEGEDVVGLIYFVLRDDDADIHIVFFDSKPAEKRDLVRVVCQLIFDAFPNLHRITAEIPDIYPVTWRLAKKVGFFWEGTKRQAAMIGGKRRDVNIYSLLRNEAYGLPKESREGSGDSGRVRDRWTGGSEDRRGSLGRGVGT